MAKNKGKQPQLAKVSTEELQELKTSLSKYNDAFSTLLGLVPAKYYLQNEDNDGTAQPDKKLSKSQKKAMKLGQEQAAKELADAKRQAKKAKYDPNTPRTVIEIQQARAAAAAQAMKEDDEEEEEVGIALNGFKDAPAVNGDDDEEDSPNESDFEDDEEDDVPTTSRSQAKLPVRAQPAKAKSTVNGTADIASSTPGVAGEANRDALLEERRKQRGEMRDKRRKDMKERKRKEKESGVPSSKRKRGENDEAGSMLPPTNKIDKPGAMSDVKKALKKEGRRQAPVPSADDDLDMPVAKASKSTPAAQAAPAKSAVVPAASTSTAAAGPSSIAFSSLDFSLSSSINAVDAPKMSKKQRDGLSKSNKVGVTSHDPSVALNALNKRGEFLAKLTPQARERAEEKDKWERMAMRAEGTKVYDEEAKLKKMVKRKEKAKDKSRKDWADRKETIVNTQAAQQKKRQDNINARLQVRKDKKLGVKPKKSVGKANPKKKGRPGFEGKGGGKK